MVFRKEYMELDGKRRHHFNGTGIHKAAGRKAHEEIEPGSRRNYTRLVTRLHAACNDITSRV
ncbi:hypothetical protein [Prevotella sp. oral taxon 376]|uniref:hypothetical protein n=1 Tax=Prevotella sp. oral taxon 376 TaxID=712466 RepID=UPI0011B29E12|nr:hypothetical protein [Prevotella sp. oral taxon 376]